MTKQKRMSRNRRIALLILVVFSTTMIFLGVAVGFSIGRAMAPIETVEAKEAEPTPETKPTLPVIQTEGRTLSPELVSAMIEMCDKYDIPLALAVAMAEQESRFNPDAVSGTNDYGLMQINKINHKWLRSVGIDPMTHKGNIEAGCYMISNAVSKYSDYNKALMAYNCGDAGANKLWKKGTYSTAYSRAVMEKYAKWDKYLKGA